MKQRHELLLMFPRFCDPSIARTLTDIMRRSHIRCAGKHTSVFTSAAQQRAAQRMCERPLMLRLSTTVAWQYRRSCICISTHRHCGVLVIIHSLILLLFWRCATIERPLLVSLLLSAMIRLSGNVRNSQVHPLRPSYQGSFTAHELNWWPSYTKSVEVGRASASRPTSYWLATCRHNNV